MNSDSRQTTGSLLWRVMASGVCLLFACLRAFCPCVTVDNTVLYLIGLAMVPWLGGILSKISFPGGGGADFRAVVEKSRQGIERLAAATRTETPALSVAAATGEVPPATELSELSRHDPALAVTGMRVDLERRLRSLARSRGALTEHLASEDLVGQLRRQGLLDQPEAAVLLRVMRMLNAPAHGATLNTETARAAIEVGEVTLRHLDAKFSGTQKVPQPDA